MARYRKAIVALAGVTGLFVLRRYLELEIPGIDYIVYEMIVSMLVAWGVYQVKNEQ